MKLKRLSRNYHGWRHYVNFFESMLQRAFGKYCLIHLFAQVFIVVSAIKMRYCTSLHFNAYTVVQLWVIHPEISYDIESSEKLFNLRVRLIFSEHPGDMCEHTGCPVILAWWGVLTQICIAQERMIEILSSYMNHPGQARYMGHLVQMYFYFLNTSIPELECGESCSFWSFVLYQASAR